MARILARLGITAGHALGRCPLCIRAAFLSSAIAWLIAGVTIAVSSPPVVAMAAVTAAVAFSILWVAHLTAFAVRAARCRVRTAAAPTAPSRLSRRDLYPVFAKAFMFVAAATALPALSTRALADCPPDAPSPCGNIWCCAKPSRFHCDGYSGTTNTPDKPWRSRGHFCIQTATLEDEADLRSNCATLVNC